MKQKKIPTARTSKKKIPKKNPMKQEKDRNEKPLSNKQKKTKNPKAKKRAIKVIIAFLVIGLLFAGIYVLLKHPKFNLQTVVVEGTSRYTTEEIVTTLGLETGKNTFIEWFTSNKGQVSILPYIDTISLGIKIPNDISIKVKERSSVYFAFDREKSRFFKIDKDGYLLEECTIEKKTESEILVYGITFDDTVTLGEKINEIDMSKIVTFVNIKKEYEKSKLNGAITKVNFENSLTTITLNDKLNVVFPNEDNIKYKLNFLKGIMSNIGDDAVGVIDMTKTNPTFSSF